MSKLKIIDSDKQERYIKTTGTGSGGNPLAIGIDPTTATPTVYNLTLTTANTEYSQAMVPNCRRFEFQARTAVAIRFAFETGKVATPTEPYMTLKAGDAYDSGIINQELEPSTLYFASAGTGIVAEIISWA